MALNKSAKRLVKFIDYILARRPDEFGLVTDADGYIKIKEFLKAVSEEEGWKYVRRSHLDEVLITVGDPPFEISDNMIRAKSRDRLPAHTFAQDPPKLLFTCVRRKAYPFVLEKGIYPLGYRRVILSSDRNLAHRMGKRIDRDPALLTVQVQKSIEKGVVYYQAGEALYLADSIPVDCFTGPPLPKEKPEARKPEKPDKRVEQRLAGSFILDIEKERNYGKKAKDSKDADWKKERRRMKKQKRKRKRPPWRQ
ncbi:MAG: RNA 2'-phosphotransferase [Desulfobacterales bacterium]|nr:MAG: RNA 2'-phosphotransferase [Desulfobacterales bacterium]